MKSIPGAILWAVAILTVAIASAAGLIARDNAANAVVALAVLAAVQIGSASRRRGDCCRDSAEAAR